MIPVRKISGPFFCLLLIYRPLYFLITQAASLVFLALDFCLKNRSWTTPKTKSFFRDKIKACSPSHLAEVKALLHRESRDSSDSCRLFWIHGSSGELETARPLMRALKKQVPNCKLLVTYSSPSAHNLAHRSPEVDCASMLPWDQPSVLSLWFAELKPEILVFSRGDLWPELLYQAQRAQVPTLLMGFAASRKLQFIQRILLEAVGAIATVSPETDSVVKFHPHHRCVGDPRYDEVFYRLENLPRFKNPFQDRKVWVLGSTWKEDLRALEPAVSEWLKRGGRVIWAPHEWSEEEAVDFHRKLNLPIERWSYWKSRWMLSESITPHHSDGVALLSVDTVGDLFSLYTWAQVAFVGGSFKARVHSVMEPLCAQVPVLVGPYFHNSAEAQKFSSVPLRRSDSSQMESRRGPSSPLSVVPVEVSGLKSLVTISWVRTKNSQNSQDLSVFEDWTKNYNWMDFVFSANLSQWLQVRAIVYAAIEKEKGATSRVIEFFSLGKS